jgi:hypothetical protein
MLISDLRQGGHVSGGPFDRNAKHAGEYLALAVAAWNGVPVMTVEHSETGGEIQGEQCFCHGFLLLANQ